MNRIRIATVLIAAGLIALVAMSPGTNQTLIRILSAPYQLVIAVQTGFKMRLIENQIWQYRKRRGKFPPEPLVDSLMRGAGSTMKPPTKLNPTSPILDPWGRPFLYLQLSKTDGYELVCLGPDGKFHTRDDVIFRYEGNKP